MPAPRAPIAILSFDRPDYLRRVLASLVAQQDAALDRRPVWLFQDGSVNPHSARRRGDPARIAACIALFRRHVPSGTVVAAPDNLGIALNYDRAERHAFVEGGHDSCIFLEDDLLLAPHYVATLDRMLELAWADPRIGYVSACGDHRTPLARQRRDPGRYGVLSGNWGVGLTRRQWLRNRVPVERYLQLVRGVDYRLRSNRRIFDLYSELGMARAVSSQDRMKAIACCLTGAVRLNTTACFGRYIGAVGVHCTRAAFERAGYDRTELYEDGPAPVAPLSDADYARLLSEQTSRLAAVAPLLRPGHDVGFGRGGAGVAALRHGFYNPDEQACWSAEPQSGLAFRIEPGRFAGGARLRLRAAHAAPQAALSLSCNGADIGRMAFGPAFATGHAELPRGVLDGATELRFALHTTVCAPRSDGQPRSLCLQSLQLSAV